MFYIALQHAQDIFEIALFADNTCIEKVQEDKRHTSKLLIPLLEKLLSRHSIELAELSFCAVNCGPGPFSTLRSIIATVNGLHCATKIPLIGIDGLKAIFLEFRNAKYQNNVVLLNAFNNESYYLIAKNDLIISTGYKNTTTLHKEIKEQFPDNNVFVIDNKICSIETIAKIGYEKFIANDFVAGYLMPLHLKKHAVER